MKKRRYRRRRTRMYRRGFRRYRSRKSRMRPEIKYLTLEQSQQAIKQTVSGGSWSGTTPDRASAGSSFFVSNLLDYIQPGNLDGQRIGRKIFVKSIKCRHMVWVCSPNQNTALNAIAVRILWATPIGTPGSTSFTNFFKTAARDRVLNAFNNDYYKLHYSKVHVINGPYENRNDSAYPYQTTGGMKYISYTIPVNREVTWDANGLLKEERDRYSLFMMASGPNIDPTGPVQLACANQTFQIYYTDS